MKKSLYSTHTKHGLRHSSWPHFWPAPDPGPSVLPRSERAAPTSVTSFQRRFHRHGCWRCGRCAFERGLRCAARKHAEKAYASGYDKGKSFAVKQQYWVYVSMQRQRSQVGNVRLYPVQLPEQRIDGAIFQPTTKYLRIEE